ncbi:LysR substrate-binding domain-containing protein [Pseudomonas gingeri]|uniref:LysR substrate-binding domain-containing protein n=1 Tax=Pseudomonas gingeri TaxID=117681 RepID=UPI002108A977|nr:LysR substrate-binding domain-containing protein [Pseudomonas gingeri]
MRPALDGNRTFLRRTARGKNRCSQTPGHLHQQQWLHQIHRHRPVVFSASDLASQQMAARCGAGAVVLPTTVGDNDPGLQRLPVDSDGPVRDLWLTVYPDLRRSPSVKAVLDFLVECVRQEPRLR